jgi:hypothetical protein
MKGPQMLAGLRLARRMDYLNALDRYRRVWSADYWGPVEATGPPQNYLGRDERAREFYMNDAARESEQRDAKRGE